MSHDKLYEKKKKYMFSCLKKCTCILRPVPLPVSYPGHCHQKRIAAARKLLRTSGHIFKSVRSFSKVIVITFLYSPRRTAVFWMTNAILPNVLVVIRKCFPTRERRKKKKNPSKIAILNPRYRVCRTLTSDYNRSLG